MRYQHALLKWPFIAKIGTDTTKHEQLQFSILKKKPWDSAAISAASCATSDRPAGWPPMVMSKNTSRSEEHIPRASKPCGQLCRTEKSEATLRETSCAIYRWSCAGMYFAGAEVSAHSAVQPTLQAAAQLPICRKFEGTFGFAILQVKRRSNASSRPVTDYTVYATMDLLCVPWCIDALALSSPTSNVPA